MENKKTERWGYFETPISTLDDVVSVKDIKEKKLKIEDHFAKVPVEFVKREYTSKSGETSVNYAMFIKLHPNITLCASNKKFINENEFLLLLMEFGLPFDTKVIKFNGYIRFLKGESLKIDTKEFVRYELYLGSNLSTLGDFVDGGTKLVANRLSLYSDEQIIKAKTTPFVKYPLCRLSAKDIKDLEDVVEVTE